MIQINIKWLLVSILVTHAIVLSSQSTYQRTLGLNDSSSIALSVAVLPDGNTIVGGYLESEAQSDEWDAALWMLNAQGTTLWSKRLNQNGNLEFIREMIATKDGNIMAIYGSQDDLFQSFAGIIKISPAGDIIWNMRHPTPSISFNNIVSVSTGYLVTGVALNPAGDRPVTLLVHENGNSIWQRQYNGSSSSYEQAVEDSEGNYLVAGFAGNDGTLSKLNSVGDHIWTRQYGGAGNDNLKQISVLADKSILLAGTTTSNNNNNVFEVFVVKTDAAGQVTWARSYKKQENDIVPNSLITFADGSALLTVTDVGSASGDGAVLLKIDASGNITQVNSYGPTGADARFNNFVSTSQNYYAVGAITDGNGTRTFVVKTDLNGQVAACCPRSADFTTQPMNIPGTVVVFNAVDLTPMLNSNFQVTEFTPLNNNFCPQVNTDFTVSDTSLCIGECITINFPNPTPNVIYSWSFPTGNPSSSTSTNPGQICFNTPGEKTITLVVNGCNANSEKTTVADGKEDQIPNAFTPDGDGENEIFRPIIICDNQIQDYTLEIYNRWGSLVFDSFQYSVGWDGMVNGQTAPIDVYFYRAIYTVSSNGVSTTITKKGDVTLLR